MGELGVSRPTFYFDVHGEINTDKTIELSRLRAEELGIGKVVVASETGLSALKVLDAFPDVEVIVVSSAAGTCVEGSVIGDLRIGIPDGHHPEGAGRPGRQGDRPLLEPRRAHEFHRRRQAGDDVL